MSQEQKWMTTSAFAKKAGLSSSKVSKLIRDGKIKATKVSGRWRIDPDQLASLASQKQSKSAPAKKGQAVPKKAAKTQKAKPAAGGKSYSISEFAAMTYLTEKGVMEWLKTGRLISQIGNKGEWSVDAANLEKADIARLVRD